MREIAIIGIGQTPVGETWEQSLRDIAGKAILSALADAQRESADGLFVGNMLSGMLSRQDNLGTIVADWTGFSGYEAFKVEAACGSGGAALRLAIFAVASGEMDCAVAVGVEKMTETLGSESNVALATAADADYEIIHGLTFVAINALVMRRYMHEYGWEHAHFADFSINAHANAVHNSNARLQNPITKEQYARSRMIAAPINLLDASPIGDGAAAVVVVPADSLRSSKQLPKITIAGSAMATDTIAIHDRNDPLWLQAAGSSAKKAYSLAGVRPQDIDVFELHDAFSIMAALSLEAAGFAEKGQGPRLALDGHISINGSIPIATRGGLKARGHPVGATGIYQIVECVQQLRGDAGQTQVAGARVAMAQNIGGSGATIITHILKAE